MPNDSGLPVPPPPHGEVVEAALTGLLAQPKTLPPKLFYDETGCRLFYRITELPEYYLTRTERSLLPRLAPIVASRLTAGTVLVEYGASDEEKASYLLRIRDTAGAGVFRAYVPIDVAGSALRQMQARLARRFPWVTVHPVVADFMKPVALPMLTKADTRLGFFPGSTIGNLEPEAAVAFLRRSRVALGTGAWFLLGADLRKDPSILLPAYDDAAGVTAAFNRNVLVRLNREAGADFDPEAFAHRAVWNDRESRIEMHLVSRRDQTVTVGGQPVRFREGETIHTENSYKHPPERIIAMAERAGWQLDRMWKDPEALFGVFLLRGEDALT